MKQRISQLVYALYTTISLVRPIYVFEDARVNQIRAYFFERIELTLPIGSGKDRVNSAQVGGAIQSKKKHSCRVMDPIGRVNSYPLKEIGRKSRTS